MRQRQIVGRRRIAAEVGSAGSGAASCALAVAANSHADADSAAMNSLVTPIIACVEPQPGGNFKARQWAIALYSPSVPSIFRVRFSQQTRGIPDHELRNCRFSVQPHFAADSRIEGAGAERCRNRTDDSHRHARARPWPAAALALHPLPRRRQATDRRTLADLADKREGPLSEGRRQQEMARFSRAPLVIGVISSPKDHPKIPQWEMFLSGGAAAMNLVLAANALRLRRQLDHQLVLRYGGGQAHSWAGAA